MFSSPSVEVINLVIALRHQFASAALRHKLAQVIQKAVGNLMMMTADHQLDAVALGADIDAPAPCHQPSAIRRSTGIIGSRWTRRADGSAFRPPPVQGGCKDCKRGHITADALFSGGANQ